MSASLPFLDGVDDPDDPADAQHQVEDGQGGDEHSVNPIVHVISPLYGFHLCFCSACHAELGCCFQRVDGFAFWVGASHVDSCFLCFVGKVCSDDCGDEG